MRLMTLLFVIFILVGCNNMERAEEKSATNKDEELKYDGDHLTVGVTEDMNLPKIKNIQYKEVNLDSLTPDQEELDALIITKAFFNEADKNKYVNFYKEVKYPVFFVGIKGFKLFAFTTEDMNIENSKDDNSAYIQGFKNTNGEKEVFKVYKSKEATDKEIFIQMFDYISK